MKNDDKSSETRKKLLEGSQYFSIQSKKRQSVYNGSCFESITIVKKPDETNRYTWKIILKEMKLEKLPKGSLGYFVGESKKLTVSVL